MNKILLNYAENNVAEKLVRTHTCTWTLTRRVHSTHSCKPRLKRWHYSSDLFGDSKR